MNPFDLRTIFLAKHAQHVVLIHFPIALFIMGVAFDLIAQKTKRRAVAAAASYNLVIAAISTLPVLLTGVIAWRLALGGAKLEGILLLHMILACTASVFMWIVGWLHFRAARKPESPLPLYRLPIEMLAVLLIGLTAHLGGFLSGVNLPG